MLLGYHTSSAQIDISIRIKGPELPTMQVVRGKNSAGQTNPTISGKAALPGGQAPASRRRFFPSFASVLTCVLPSGKIKQHIAEEEKVLKLVSRYASATTRPVPGTVKVKKNALPVRWVLFLGLSWVIAGVFAYLYFFPGRPDNPPQPRLTIQSGGDLRQWESVLLKKERTIRHLEARIKAMSERIQAASEDLRSSRNEESEYRKEALQLALRYQAELDTLRNAVSERDAVVLGLRKELNEAKSVSKGSGSEGVPPPGFSMQKAGMPGSEPLLGKVVMINSRYRFVIVDVGARRGVRPGEKVHFLNGTEVVAVGNVEEVYPGVAGVSVWDAQALERITENQQVSVERNAAASSAGEN